MLCRNCNLFAEKVTPNGLADVQEFNSRTFVCKFSSFSDHFPQLTPRCKRLPNLILMHLLVSLNLVPFALVIFHCLILNFPPTKKVPVLIDCLISAWYELAWFSDCICCCCKYFSCRQAGRTAWAVEDIRSINFVSLLNQNSGLRVRKEILSFQNYLFYHFLLHCQSHGVDIWF